MQLVTVTCNRDFNQMLLQAESINKFVKTPCHHYVIINEPEVDLKFWNRWLSKYYTTHTLHLIPRIVYDYEKYGLASFDNNAHVGWKTQQLQKLLIAYLINDDYVILDSKDFFINDTNINEWDTSIGSTVSDESEVTIYDSSSIAYARYFNVGKRAKLFHQYTPYVIRKKYITENKNFDFFTLGDALYFANTTTKGISEFVFYSYLVPEDHDVWKINLGPNPKAIKFFSISDYNWSSSEFFVDFIKTCNNAKVNIVGIHPRILSEIDEKTLDLMNKLLYNKYALTTKLLPIPK